MSTAMTLREFGFDQWFETHAGASATEFGRIARVIAIDRGVYRIDDTAGEVPAELSGRLAYGIASSMDLPCVGDWVAAQYYNDDTAAIIHQVLPRKTFLRRKPPGEHAEVQMIAANVDIAFLMQSCHVDFNPSRLERYLVMAADGGVEPHVVLTKTDLITQEELALQRAHIAAITTARVLTVSNVTGEGVDALQQTLTPGKTCCLLGSSGVGKTTLLNRLLGREAFATRAVSGTGEGTHTTTRRQLVVLDSRALLIDTPGMRELGIASAADGIETGLEAVAALAAHCQYADCSHGHEPGCAVRKALDQGELPAERYANYLKLKKESAFHEMSSLDRRKKDKAFGKMLKSIKKRSRR